MQITDEAGRTVVFPPMPHRIVSLAPSVTEMLFALGLGDRVVGDTNYCSYPPEARNRPHVGGPSNPNIERVAALRPDLVIVARSANRLETVHSLEQLHIPVYATDPHTVDQVITSAKRLSEVLGAEAKGEILVSQLRQQLANIDRRLSGVPRKDVLMVVWLDPLISVGRNTFLADALERAGGRSVIDTSQDWPKVSIEAVVRLQPEYLVFSSDQPDQVRHQMEEMRERAGWKQLEAVRSGRVIVVSEALIEPSPRLIDVIEELARALHPDRFAAWAPLQPAIPTTRSGHARQSWLAYPETENQSCAC